MFPSTWPQVADYLRNTYGSSDTVVPSQDLAGMVCSFLPVPSVPPVLEVRAVGGNLGVPEVAQVPTPNYAFPRFAFSGTSLLTVPEGQALGFVDKASPASFTLVPVQPLNYNSPQLQVWLGVGGGDYAIVEADGTQRRFVPGGESSSRTLVVLYPWVLSQTLITGMQRAFPEIFANNCAGLNEADRALYRLGPEQCFPGLPPPPMPPVRPQGNVVGWLRNTYFRFGTEMRAADLLGCRFRLSATIQEGQYRIPVYVRGVLYNSDEVRDPQVPPGPVGTNVLEFTAVLAPNQFAVAVQFVQDGKDAPLVLSTDGPVGQVFSQTYDGMTLQRVSGTTTPPADPVTSMGVLLRGSRAASPGGEITWQSVGPREAGNGGSGAGFLLAAEAWEPVLLSSNLRFRFLETGQQLVPNTNDAALLGF